MTKLKFLYLYPNMMDLYGDSGNLQILKYRAEKRGHKVQIDSHTVTDPAPDFSRYDLIFLGGGSDKEQKVVARDILKYAKELKNAYQQGIFFLTICGGFQLFGKYYKDAENNLIKGLHLFDFYTESSTDKRQRCIGNIVIETTLPPLPDSLFSKKPSSKNSSSKTPPHHLQSSHPIKLVGFENHGGQTHGVETPLGRVLSGNGNTFKNASEGFMTANFIGTYLHGPLLSKNPELADYILSNCLTRQTGHTPNLAPLDDRFEIAAKREMLAKLL